ncbi:glycoside hydrolase family 17 protein [Melanomma pulvis-pyrius CBS 109.77]|uniref:Glycoside hydrolase family 17 protein n=1 Tax=Melanomma pulvis-pyrius CBS 109.77 TaxID=1314802 RepID=A0A6A6XEP1_9PLEO|nr:glycoside hydrolase family 17 protein [Melanomma pulvis-pyrius CBS 109.77]
MKATAFARALAAGVVFAGIAGGHPHKLKRDLVTEVVYTTVTVADVIVWVDENGVPYETTTMDLATTIASTVTDASTTSIVEATPSAAAASALPSLVIVSQNAVATSDAVGPPPVTTSIAVESHAEPSQSPVETSAPPAPPAPAPQAPPPPAPSSEKPAVPSALPMSSPKPAPIPQAASDDAFPLGVTYDPFKPGACKTEDEITNELNNMKSFGIIRIYGMGCNVIPLTVQHAKANNQKIMAGIYRGADPNNNENIDTVVQVLSDAVKQYAGGDWSIISLVSVENEKVNSHEMTASDVVNTIQTARGALRNAGYNGPVGAVETVPATVDNPSVCTESDLALVNIHAFFDEHTQAADAGDFVKGQIELVKNACPNKRVIVTESGWPHQGDSHGNAVASPEAQKAAMDSIRSKFDHDVFLFNAYDSMWKTDDASTHNAEKFWGIL